MQKTAVKSWAISLRRRSAIIKQKSYEYLLLKYTISIMPIITISLFSGRTQREKDRLAEAITESACNILEVDKKEVIVIFREEPRGNWYSEGVRI
ncbi:MAG: 4-oxalocrotonate tautomerase family protein [Nitrososphaeraceae archaeon]